MSSISSLQSTGFNYEFPSIEKKEIKYDSLFERKVTDTASSQEEVKDIKQRKWSSILYSRAAYYGSKFFKVVRSVADAAYQTFSSSYEMLSTSNSLQITKMFELILLPFIAANLVKNVSQVIKGDRDTKIDSAISMVDEVGTLGGSMTTLAMGLATIGIISAKIFEWAAPLYLISSIFSGATMFQSMRSSSRINELEKDIKKNTLNEADDAETTMRCYEAAMKVIKDKKRMDHAFTKYVFNCGPNKLVNRMIEIRDVAAKKMLSLDDDEVREGKAMLTKTLKCMTRKIHAVGTSSKLSSVVSVVSVIGAVALFTVPIHPISYAIIGLGALLNMSNLIYYKIADYQFTHEMNMKKKWHEWIAG